MTTYYEQLEAAEQMIADADNGAYDDALGITADQRTAITKARAGEPITADQFAALADLGELDLADKAYKRGQVITPATTPDDLQFF